MNAWRLSPRVAVGITSTWRTTHRRNGPLGRYTAYGRWLRGTASKDETLSKAGKRIVLKHLDLQN